MLLLSHHEVSLRRHVGAAFGTATATATLTSLVYCALLPSAPPALMGREVTAELLWAAFVYGWVRTALFAFGVAAVLFSLLRALDPR